jgi:phosphoribosylformylglycinamidine synthase
LNICSNEYKARQYDHEVKGLSVLKPFGGVYRDIAADATVTMIEPLSKEGVILASAILPRYSDIDTYDMAASCIDLAVRRVIAVGGNLNMIAGLDNFCWPDPVQSAKTPDGEYKLAQLVRANEALYEYTKKYVVPCISGKDSMKNDSTRGGRKISIPPSLLFSVISKMDDIRLAITPDAKRAGDYVYVIGDTKAELGGSEYYSMLGATGNRVPEVDAEKFISLYGKVVESTGKRLFNSLITPGLGGLAVAFAKTAMAGRLGLNIDLDKVPASEKITAAELLFSESNGRFVATVAPEKAAEFEALFAGCPVTRAGVVTSDAAVSFKDGDEKISASLDDMLASYKGTLDNI